MSNSKITPKYVKELLDKITPGEWSDDQRGFISTVNKGREIGIAETCDYGEYLENAELIAAAPRIAEAYLEAKKEAHRLQLKVEDYYERSVNWEIIRGDDLTQWDRRAFAYEREVTNLRAIVEKQREALEKIDRIAGECCPQNFQEGIGEIYTITTKFIESLEDTSQEDK